MADAKGVIEQGYSAFNKRDIDGALALMTEDVSWPRRRKEEKLSVRKSSAPTGLANGASLIHMSNRWRLLKRTMASSASECTNSSRAFKGISCRTARFCTYSL